jgi:hypothetical protein
MLGDTLRGIRPMDGDGVNPNSGINSSAEDMGRWMLAQLNGGLGEDSVQVWRRWSQGQLWRGETPIRASELQELSQMRRLGLPAAYFDVQPRFRLYAPGASVMDYRGHLIVSQQGEIPGYATQLVYVPSLNLGISVLSNLEGQDGVLAVMYRLLDEHLGVGSTDWTTILDSTRRTLQRSIQEFRKEIPNTMAQLDSSLRDSTRAASLPTYKYAGRYEDPWYGRMTIEFTEGGALTLTMDGSPGLIGDVRHWERDVFTVRWRDRSLNMDAFIWFSFDRRGEIEGARMEAMDSDRFLFRSPFSDLRFIRRGY